MEGRILKAQTREGAQGEGTLCDRKVGRAPEVSSGHSLDTMGAHDQREEER